MNQVAVIAVTFAALAVGCKKKADDKPAATPPPPVTQPPAPLDAAAAVVDAAPPPLTPAIPAGKIGVQILDLQYAGAASPGLPAIRADGSQFAVVVIADDGGRGYLDLTLRTIDATTAKVVKQWVLTDPNKTSDGEQDDAKAKAVDDAAIAAVAAANAELATAPWRSLTPVTVPEHTGQDNTVASTLVAGDTRFTYLDGKLTLAKDGAAPLVKTYQQLTGEKRPTPPGDGEDCKGEREYLSSIAVDAPSQRALVGFDFVTGHNCGDGGTVYGVVALP